MQVESNCTDFPKSDNGLGADTQNYRIGVVSCRLGRIGRSIDPCGDGDDLVGIARDRRGCRRIAEGVGNIGGRDRCVLHAVPVGAGLVQAVVVGNQKGCQRLTPAASDGKGEALRFRCRGGRVEGAEWDRSGSGRKTAAALGKNDRLQTEGAGSRNSRFEREQDDDARYTDRMTYHNIIPGGKACPLHQEAG